ncbi:synaptotagmin-like protein 2 isoform X7 [Anguilla rostrata]|uniref:synaptotagmin-like protein 2 isoform X7 n=1 Tax=Anguilla rostrata TaxID=7938 RepID=UPI0030D5E942
MIDLSHLTEEEQEMIVSVLKRDAELKKADEERIRRLRKAAQDTGKLKYLTGEWFYQTKSQRHRDRIHGSDIIRAAMKQRKPMTILEITQIWAERPSFVNSEIQDIFVPAELSGLIEEPSTQATEKRASGSVSPDVQKDGVILALQSPPKIRRNPFNSVLVGSEASEEPEPQFTNWEAEPITPSDEELLPPSKSPIGNLDKITSEDAGTLEAALPITTPLPQKRTVVHPPLDSLSYNNELFPKWSSVAVERSTVSVAPRGILKRSSSCSSADLPAFCIDRDDGGCSESTDSQKAQQPEKNDRPAQRSESLHSLDRKQVRFSTTVRMSETEEGSTLLADGEFGEHDLLDMQCETFPDEERGECKLGIGSFMGESNNDLTHHGAECKFQKETGDPIPTMTVAESIPGEVTMPATSESQHSRLGSKWEEVDTGQHEYSSESCTQGSEDQKGCDESQSPVKALKQICARPIAVSRSLGDITSQQTLSPVSTSPSSSFSDQDQMKKRCASMPAFLHGEMDGRDSDSDSENSFHLGGRKSSASTNFSTSSGMASMSSASSSLMSIYSLEFENVEVKGTIQFALSYVQKLGELHVFVVRCRDLAVADNKKNRSDPYVKSYLLPDKAKLGKKKTTVKKKTLNPIYNEILRYKIDVKTLKSHTLNLSVWHHNSFGKNSFLGEVDFKLSEWDLTNTHMNDFTLKGKSPSGLQPTDHRGEIRVALRFLQQGSHGKRTPKTGLVQIFVKDCKNLPFIRGAVIDPFVKCYVLPDTSRKSRQKSRVLRKTANPVFNHTMVYDGFRAEDLEEACVELTVWDHDRLNNHFLGGVRLSLGTGRSHGAVVDWMDSNAAEAMLWKQMMESHNEWVEDVLPLRMLMMAHSMSK